MNICVVALERPDTALSLPAGGNAFGRLMDRGEKKDPSRKTWGLFLF
jgi:hypothetical protein